ncbi:deleted in malignant brain tumors 1 protein isoform X3 [Kryptolebias marmoratus]|uniref:deleted in malignant brain tumors 1 protein isoform X3 n=1 Tax=Kryptolebias marmoratus TaxID=37003 RepID=UPI0007F8AB5E|nr:deleted in malignant brain tumors 1 protein isoform X3 [Kryptolebias marmoratus]
MLAFLFLCSVFITHGVRGQTTSEMETETSSGVVSCGGYFYGSSGTFSSPNYPNHYPNNADCIWYIRPNRQIVELKFFNVNTECSYDDIYVYDGSYTGSRLLGKFCYSNRTTFYSTQQYLTVRFRSDSSVNYPGFYATYSVVAEGLCENNCGYQVGNCSCSASCEYWGKCCADYREVCLATTVPTAPTSSTGHISCRYNCGSHLGSCSCSSSCRYYGNCCHDYYSYCSSSTNSPVTARPSCRYNCGSHMGSCSCSSSCQYYGNCCHDYSYYCAATTPPVSSCGGALWNSGTFSSPNHPGYYHDNAYCLWQLRASYDQRIFLAFTYLQLENCCSCDYISVYDGPSVNSQFLGKVCNNSLSTFYSSSNYMTVVFRTDGSVVGRGFSAEFMSSLNPNSGRVDCSSDNMNIVIDRSYLNSLGYDGHNLYLDDPYCRPQVSSYQVVFSFPLNTCGNVRKFVNGKVVYTNTLRGFPSTHGEITRQSHLKMKVNCLMQPDSVSQTLFVVHPKNISSISGSGRYNTSMAFYTSSSFYYEVTEVPYEVTLNQNLYVQVNMRRPDSSLVLFLDTCVASPTPFDFHTRAYYLVRDGCRVDNTYQPISTGTSYRARFTFRAFQFLRATDSVYLQCKVVICPASDGNSRCRRGCSRRVARELESEHHSQTLVLGPIKLKESEKKKEEEPEKQNKA